MLKRLAILAAICAIWVFGQPSKAADQNQPISDKANPDMVAAKRQDKDRYSERAQAKAYNEGPRWYAVLERPDWWVVIIAALTGGIISWQSIETRKAAKGAQISAKASLLNAQYLVSSERPWLVVHAIGAEFTTFQEAERLPRIQCEVKNVGRTPARIIEGAARFIFNLDTYPLPDKPDYGEAESYNGRILLPGEAFRFWAYWYEAKGGKYRRLFERPEITALDLLVGFGYIKYGDTFEVGNQYISSFCDRCFLGPNHVSDEFAPMDDFYLDPEYTKHT